MADSSGFSNLAGVTRIAATVSQAKVEKTNAEIVNLPPNLRNETRQTRIKGEVTRITPDRQTGETRIEVQTPRGPVEIKIPPGQPIPREGQAIEIEIPPQTQTQSQTQTEPTTTRPAQSIPVVIYTPVLQSPTTDNQNLPPRTTSTPVTVSVGRPNTIQATAVQEVLLQVLQSNYPSQNTLPSPDTVVRLLPIAPKELETLLTNQISPALTLSSQQVISLPSLFPLPVNFNQTLDFAIQAKGIEKKISSLNAPLVILTPSFSDNSFFTPSAQNTELTAPQTPNVFNLNTSISITRFVSVFETPAVVTPEATENSTTLKTTLSESLNIARTNAPDLGLDARVISTANPQVALLDPQNPKIQNQQPNIILDSKNPIFLKPDSSSMLSGSISASIIGFTPQFLPILALYSPQEESLKTFILQTPIITLPLGATLNLMPQGEAITLKMNALPSPLSVLMPGSWPAMEELQNTMMQVTTLPNPQMLSNISPNTNNPSQMMPAALFFIAAMRGGNLDGWLGEKSSDALRIAGKTSILSKFSQESGMLNRVSTDQAGNEWRSAAMPMYHNGDLQKIILHYKKEQNADSSATEKGKGMRFIFDLALDRMGKVQVDGLFRPGRLDLVIRTEEHLSQAMQMNMRRVYAQGLRETNITGEITFQNKPEQWVTIQPQQRQHFGVTA